MKTIHPLIITALHNAFAHVAWGDWRTHLEWDYADTSFCHRHFDQAPYTDDPILKASYERELHKL
jgi:hypothetical protein